MRVRIGALIGAAVVALSACNAQPVEPNAARPNAPAFDGGHTYGSGNVVAPPPAPETTTAATLTSDAAADTTSRGGHTYGSGN